MKLFDRLIDHVVDRVQARSAHNSREAHIRAKANRKITFDGITMTTLDDLKRHQEQQAMQHPGRSA